ncbi:MAG: hypothetical protein AABP62_29970 [Planctomycetota bacterium]
MQWSLVVLILFTILSCVASLFGLVIGALGIRHHGRGEESLSGQDVCVFILMAMPLVCLLSIPASWYLYFNQALTAACWVSLLPFANIVFAGLALRHLD